MDLSAIGKELEKFHKDASKKIRLASYRALEGTAEQAMKQVQSDWSKYFPDENGIVKNKGIPKQLTRRGLLDKDKMSIKIQFRDGKEDVDKFMADQEEGGTRTGMNGKSRAIPTLKTMQKGRTAKGSMKAQYSVKQLMEAALKKERKRSKKAGKPKPFLLTSSSGHHMIVRRLGKEKNPLEILYHFDKKVNIRPRWNFVKTVEDIAVRNLEKNFEKELDKLIKK